MLVLVHLLITLKGRFLFKRVSCQGQQLTRSLLSLRARLQLSHNLLQLEGALLTCHLTGHDDRSVGKDKTGLAPPANLVHEFMRSGC